MNAANLGAIRSMYASHQVAYHGGEDHERAARRSEALAEFDALMDGLRSEGWEKGYQDSYDEARQRSTFGRTDNPYRRVDQ